MNHFNKLQCKQKGNAAVIILLLVAVVAISYFLISKGIVKNPLQSFSNSNLGSQIFKKVQSSSGEVAPDTNPFAKVNPFKGVYKNPFE